MQGGSMDGGDYEGGLSEERIRAIVREEIEENNGGGSYYAASSSAGIGMSMANERALQRLSDELEHLRQQFSSGNFQQEFLQFIRTEVAGIQSENYSSFFAELRQIYDQHKNWPNQYGQKPPIERFMIEAFAIFAGPFFYQDIPTVRTIGVGEGFAKSMEMAGFPMSDEVTRRVEKLREDILEEFKPIFDMIADPNLALSARVRAFTLLDKETPS